MNPLELRGVTKNWPAFTLGPLDLVVPRGYVTGLIGANGAGKTTAIKIALGLVKPDAGAVTLVDKARVGVVFDQHAYPPWWRVCEVGAGLAPFFPTWDDGAWQRMLAWAEIDPRAKVKELSRGQGMRLQVAAAFSHGAELLVLDEPTSGLDPLARSQLLDLVAEFMTDEEHAVLFSSHITTDLERIADHVTVLDRGRVVASGTRDEVLDGFRRVSGGASVLDAGLRPLVLGLREHRAGWEGLMATEDTVGLGGVAVVEAPTLEEIAVALAKEGRHE